MKFLTILSILCVLFAATPVQGFKAVKNGIHEILSTQSNKLLNHHEGWRHENHKKLVDSLKDIERHLKKQSKRLRGGAGNPNEVATNLLPPLTIEAEAATPSATGNIVVEAVNSARRMLFNVFRSYEKVPMSEKPPQYSRAGKRSHPEDEYLSRDQKKMKKYRYTESSPAEDQFDGTWSGHKQYAELKALRGASAMTAADK